MCKLFAAYDTTEKRISLLQQTHLFHAVEDTIVRRFLEGSEVVLSKPGEEFITAGIETTDGYLLLSGLAQIYDETAASKYKGFVGYRGAGTQMRLCSLVEPDISAYSARALTDCILLKTPRSLFLQCYDDSAQLSRNLLRYFVDILRREIEYKTLVSRADRPGQVMCQLLQIRDAQNLRLLSDLQLPMTIQGFTYRHLKENFGISQDTVAEANKLLRKAGAIRGGEKRGEAIAILNGRKLREQLLRRLRS